MTTLLVNIHDEQQERVLLAFLNSLKYEYSTDSQSEISDAQQKEILRRERDFKAGKIKTEPGRKLKNAFCINVQDRVISNSLG